MTKNEEKIKKALSEAVSVLYFDDSSDYETSLWRIVMLLGGEEAVKLLEEDGSAAFHKYCK